MKKSVLLIILMIASAEIFIPSTAFSANLSISYFGETVFHPGISAGYETAIADGETFDWFWSGDISSYLHIRNHFALLGSLQTGVRFTAPFGLFFEAAGGLGGMLRTPAGTVYTENSDAAGVIEETDAVTAALIIPVSAGAGWDFRSASGVPAAVFMTIGFIGEYPYNYYILPHLTAEAGVRFTL